MTASGFGYVMRSHSPLGRYDPVRLEEERGAMHDACRSPQVVSSYKLAPTALLVLKKDNFIRKPLIRFVKWKPFDWFMLTVILANCITLAMQSNAPGFADSPMGQALRLSDLVFIALFTWEAACKIIALGFLFAQHTYLRSGERPSGATDGRGAWDEPVVC